jgi:hypothetical protein
MNRHVYCLWLAQRARSSPSHAWRYITAPIGPSGEADMQAAQSELIAVKSRDQVGKDR